MMEHVGVKEIPKRYILKRWTKDVRDILPQHLAHLQKDRDVNRPFMGRSSTLYLHVMELVRFVDALVAYIL